ncbi:DUF3986 family protein [Alkalihalobacillus sp. CinArs1]|uniref:DUF3986 family protein n=1 Tax=Alkalihalobacillus sp. CinArs1 TaxID=2995314 RepID=UPI0022DD9FE9|nr:DUF3986 family protein [Alkalihalobacillus sp. CinArs1]
MYDASQHLHIGYYEDGYDYEVIAYKREKEAVWDVFVEEYDPKLYRSVSKVGNWVSVKGHGLHIFSISDNDLSYEHGARLFKNFLVDKGIV